jgi:hypothetical protein
VRLGAIFAANARAVFAGETGRSETHRPARLFELRGMPGWARPAFALSLALVALLAVINLVLWGRISRLGAPQAYPAFFLRGAARGGEQVLEAPRSAGFVGLSLDLPADRRFPKYRSKVVDAAGISRFSIEMQAPRDPSAPVNLLLPAADLASGRYTLVLEGLGGGAVAELGQFPFLLQIQ